MQGHKGAWLLSADGVQSAVLRQFVRPILRILNLRKLLFMNSTLECNGKANRDKHIFYYSEYRDLLEGHRICE